MIKLFAWVFGIIILLTVGFAATGIITAPFRSVAGIVDRTLDADNVIGNYEWFHRQHEDILAMDTKIASAQSSYDGFTAGAGPQDKWTFEDKTERNRMNGVLLGLRNQKHMMVAEYNAKSSMVNRAIFKGNLPVTLPDN